MGKLSNACQAFVLFILSGIKAMPAGLDRSVEYTIFFQGIYFEASLNKLSSGLVVLLAESVPDAIDECGF